MKLKIMIMTLLLVSAVGIGSAVNYLPATEFVGDVDMGGYDIFGSEYVNEFDIDWSDFEYRIFNGTTEAELEAFISTHGSGTYYINQQVEISDQWIVNQEFLRFVAPYPGAAWSDGRSIFNITTTTSPAIRITGQYIDFDDCVFVAANTTSTNTLVQVDSNHVHFHRCDWIGNSAMSGVVRINEAFGTHLIDPMIDMPGTGHAIVLYSTNNTHHNLATYIRGSGFSRGIYNGGVGIYAYGYIEAPLISDLIIYNCRHGIYLVPTANDSILNVQMDRVNPDFANNGGNGLMISDDAGSYTVRRLFIDNCWFYTHNDGSYCIEVKVPLRDSAIRGGYYQTGSNVAGMYFAYLDNCIISGITMLCSDVAAEGIVVNDGDVFRITDNHIMSTSKGIQINAADGNYMVALNYVQGGITDTPGAMLTTGNMAS